MSAKKIVFIVITVVIAFMAGAFWYSLNGHTGIVRGEVVVGPQCPTVREAHECAGEPYDTKVNIFKPTGEEREVFRAVPTDMEGKFNARLKEGMYVMKAAGGDPFPLCSGKDVEVRAGTTTRVMLRCDTGIR